MAREQREAEAFARAVDHMLEGSTPPSAANMELCLLELAYQLWQTASQAMIDPSFRATLQQRLVQQKRAAAAVAFRTPRCATQPRHCTTDAAGHAGAESPDRQAFLQRRPGSPWPYALPAAGLGESSGDPARRSAVVYLGGARNRLPQGRARDRHNPQKQPDAAVDSVPSGDS